MTRKKQRRQRQPQLPSLHSTTHLFKLLPSIPLSLRKDLMTLLRVGGVHRVNSRIRTRLSSMLQTSILQQTSAGIRVYSYTELMSIIEPFISTPVLRGLLSLFLRTVYLEDPEDGKKALQSGITKEISATQCTTKIPTLSYPMLSSYNFAATVPMHQDLPFRPFLQVYMHNRLLQWKRSLESHLFLPQCSFKTIGEISTLNLLSTSEMQADPVRKYKASTADLEFLYSESGKKVDGPCEVRVAWRYNDLKPRVYYAIGASAYFAARYTWFIFDSLQRSFRCTDPHLRKSFYRFPLIDFTSEVFLIYDYSSFTSSLADFPRFIEELGVFLKGTRSKLFDTSTGITEFDLSELLYVYNEICNKDGEFDVSRVVHLEDGTSRLILQHHVAGMLGVYGNITGSTALHGFVGMTISGGEDRINAIGDDAGGVFDSENMDLEAIKDCIRVIGDISEDKFEIWTEDQESTEDGIGWHFTKRPLNVHYGVVTVGWMPDFPIYPVLLAQEDDIHTVSESSFDERRRMCIRQSIRLIESMNRHIGMVTDTDIQIVIEFLTWLFVELKIPIDGSLPVRAYHLRPSKNTSYPDRYLASPVLNRESITNGWWATLTSSVSSDTGYITLPDTSRPVSLPLKMTQGTEFWSEGSKMLGIMEKIGVVRKRLQVEDVLVSERSLERLDSVIRGDVRNVYEYTCLRNYDPWISFMTHIGHI